MAVTTYDIARELGTTQATVSRALRDDPKVAPATRQRVKEQARKMGYRPNLLARSLSKGKTHIINMVMCDFSHEAARKKLRKMHDMISEKGYAFSFTLMEPGIENEVRLIDDLRSKGVDGLVISTQAKHSDENSYRHLRSLDEEGYPYVLFDSGKNLRDFSGCYVCLDRAEAGRMAVRHFLELGHRKIGYLTSDAGEEYLHKRWGYEQEMRESGLQPRILSWSGMQAGFRDAYQFVMDNCEAVREVSALFCYSDKIALGAIRAFSELGISVPDEIAIIGFDNDNMCEISIPTLSTIGQPVEQLVQAAVDVLFEKIQVGRKQISRTILIKPQLIIRESSGQAIG